jgi:hypothetical protein
MNKSRNPDTESTMWWSVPAYEVVTPSSDRSGYVFISYKREELQHAQKLRAALKKLGFRVWWDEDIQCGQVWSDVLDRAVADAGCVVVIWSSRSIRSRWVAHEASSAMNRGIYAPVRIELLKIEAPYDRIQATDLIDWDGEPNHPGFVDLVNHVGTLLPARRTPLQVLLDWSRMNRVAIAALFFALTTLGILVWQIVVTNGSIRRLDMVLEEERQRAEMSQARHTESLHHLTRGLLPLRPLSLSVRLSVPNSPEFLSFLRAFTEAAEREVKQYKEAGEILSAGSFWKSGLDVTSDGDVFGELFSGHTDAVFPGGSDAGSYRSMPFHPEIRHAFATFALDVLVCSGNRIDAENFDQEEIRFQSDLIASLVLSSDQLEGPVEDGAQLVYDAQTGSAEFRATMVAPEGGIQDKTGEVRSIVDLPGKTLLLKPYFTGSSKVHDGIWINFDEIKVIDLVGTLVMRFGDRVYFVSIKSFSKVISDDGWTLYKIELPNDSFAFG